LKKLLIFPFNGNGLEALSCLTNSDDFEFIGFVDDTPEKQGKHEYGFTVYGREAFEKFKDAFVIAVPGSPTSFTERNNIISNLKLDKHRFTSIIHPKANISPLANIGYNVLIMAGVCITANATIGNHVCILPNTVIHHDAKVGDYTLIGSNATIAGNSEIGAKCYIGSGTSIINNISVGEKTLIGLGTNVIASIPSNSKAVGNPSRIIS
jgi:sugar O-acyltransferase (sialic acid O-acetyltransferase NeuD family)